MNLTPYGNWLKRLDKCMLNLESTVALDNESLCSKFRACHVNVFHGLEHIVSTYKIRIHLFRTLYLSVVVVVY